VEVFVDFENMSVEEIERLVTDYEQNRDNALMALEHRKEQAKYELAQAIKDMVTDQGYSLNDIVPLLGARKRRGPGRPAVVRPPVVTRRATGDRQYARYVDPENAENIYSRGAIPGWMKQKMQDQGYDPSKKADRNVFKANYLRVKEG